MKKIVNIGRIFIIPMLIGQIVFMFLGPFFEIIDANESSRIFMITGLYFVAVSGLMLQMCYRHIKKLEQAGKQDVVSSKQDVVSSKQDVVSSSQTVEASSNDVVNTNNNVEPSSQAKV